MVYINEQISKREFLQKLTGEASRPGTLFIQVDSLPSFLSTQISFTIFLYQINSYPRHIIWVTQNQALLRFLQECNVQVDTEAHPSSHSNLEVIAALPDSTHFFSEPAQLIQNTPKSIESRTTQKISQIKENSEGQAYKFPIFSEPDVNTSQVLNSHDLLKDSTYHPSSLLSEQKVYDNPSNSSPQNLDSWLEKITATKDALASLRDNTKYTTNTSTTPEYVESNLPAIYNSASFSPKKKTNGVFTRLRNAPRSLYILSGSFVACIMLVGVLLLFPTTAYTLQVEPVTQQTSTEITYKPGDFNKKTVKLSSQANVPASGQKEVVTDRATGKVNLVNPGSKDVEITNGSFRLIVDNKEYQSLRNTTLPQTIVIPAKNNLNGPTIEMSIQSREPGSDYNLNENTTFKIVNVLGQNVCSSCYAVSTSAIKNTDLSGQKIVTDADYSLLRTTNEGILAERRVQEIKAIQESRIITNVNWFKNLDSKFNFDKQIGEAADNVGLQEDVSADLYYLTQPIIETTLKNINPEISKVTDLAVVESNGTFDNDQSKLKLKVFYTYVKELPIDKDKVTQALQDKEFEDAKSDIQKNYPGVKTIEKKELGVKVPGLSPRVDVNIVKQST